MERNENAPKSNDHSDLDYHLDLKRLVVGIDTTGKVVTMRCFINEDASGIVTKFYYDRFPTAYGQEIVHQVDGTFQSIGNAIEEQLKSMRLSWIHIFKWLDRDLQATIRHHDPTKRMFIAYTGDEQDVWVSWKLKVNKKGEPTPYLTYWRSSTGFGNANKINEIYDEIDRSTMVYEIRHCSYISKGWDSIILNQLALRYNLEHPPQLESGIKGKTRKRAAPAVLNDRPPTIKKLKTSEEKDVGIEKEKAGVKTPLATPDES